MSSDPVDPVALLEALGSSPDAVAATLRAKGVRGRRGDAEYCPLANYLRHETGLDWASVGISSFYVADRVCPAPGWPLPLACERFARRFDRGQYDDLLVQPDAT